MGIMARSVRAHECVTPHILFAGYHPGGKHGGAVVEHALYWYQENSRKFASLSDSS